MRGRPDAFKVIWLTLWDVQRDEIRYLHIRTAHCPVSSPAALNGWALTEFNLGTIDIETLMSMFTRQCYIGWEKDGMIHVTILASKSLLKQLGKKRVMRERNYSPKIIDNL